MLGIFHTNVMMHDTKSNFCLPHSAHTHPEIDASRLASAELL